MKASGNSNPMQCVQNLVCIVRGENPYERCKGIDPTIIDQPYDIAKILLKQDVEWLIETYEPRVNLNDVDLDSLLSEEGAFRLLINATLKGGS